MSLNYLLALAKRYGNLGIHCSARKYIFLKFKRNVKWKKEITYVFSSK